MRETSWWGIALLSGRVTVPAMKISTAEVIATGTELLQGRTLNRHGYVLGDLLIAHGVVLERETVLPDDPHRIEGCIREAMQRVDVVFVTGGLGPTDDDRTLGAAAAALGRGVVHDPKADAHLERFFKKIGRVPTKAQRGQACIVDGADVWINPVGLAPGQRIEHKDGVVILLPGPPRELRGVVEQDVVPWLRCCTQDEAGTVMRHFRILGLSESLIQERVVEALTPSPSLDLSYCARLGSVECRVTGPESDVLPAAICLEELFADDLLNATGESTAVTLAGLLTEKGLTVATAESCTAGGIAEALTDVPGSSAFLLGGIVAYADAMKVQHLGVAAGTLERCGAVSADVAAEMAEGARQAMQADLGVSITGIAGPGGGTEEKPVGLFYIAVAGDAGTETFRYMAGGNRAQVRGLGVQRALEQLWRRVKR